MPLHRLSPRYGVSTGGRPHLGFGPLVDPIDEQPSIAPPTAGRSLGRPLRERLLRYILDNQRARALRQHRGFLQGEDR
jgi:hypothetical protein